MSIVKHKKEHLQLGLDRKTSAEIKYNDIIFSHLSGGQYRKAMGTAPTITSAATTSMAGTPREYILGYGTALDSISVYGFHQDPTYTSGGFKGDNVTTDYALSTFNAFSLKFSFIHTGRYFELEFQTGTTNVFYCKVDDEYESLTPITETENFRQYDFGSSGTRRIDFIACSTTGDQFQMKRLYVGATDDLLKAPLRGPKTIIIGDSFCGNAANFTLAFADSMGWDDVWASGVGGSGYVATNGDTEPTFGMRVQHDVIDHNPQVVGIVGSINDDTFGYTAIYNAAYSLYTTLRAALPKAVIFAAPTASSGVDGMTSAAIANHEATKDAAAAAGIIYADVIERPLGNDSPVSTTAAYQSLAGASVVYLDIAWGTNELCFGLPGCTLSLNNDTERYYVKSTQTNSGITQCNLVGTLASNNEADDPVDVIGGSYLVGIGKVGATTGYGNCDLLVEAVGVHPTFPAGHYALGYAIASTLVNAVVGLQD